MVARRSLVNSIVTISVCLFNFTFASASKPNFRSQTLSSSLQVGVGHTGESQANQQSCPVSRDPAAVSLKVHAEQLLPTKTKAKHKAVTLVTQGTVDRLESFAQILNRWKGPISVVFYARSGHADMRYVGTFANEANHLRMWVHSQKRRFAAGSSIKLVTDSNVSRPYPINVLRNIALGAARTPFVFPLDIDFVPSQDLYHELITHLPRVKEAIVVPAFEVMDGNIHLPTPPTKAQLVRRIPKSFHEDKAPFAHKATKPIKWLGNTREKYRIQVDARTHESYEPYVVVRRKSLPGYDERFMGYGFNKVQWILCLRCTGYRFSVLGRSFVTHVTHETKNVHTDAARREQHVRSDTAMTNFVKELHCPAGRYPKYRNRFFS